MNPEEQEQQGSAHQRQQGWQQPTPQGYQPVPPLYGQQPPAPKQVAPVENPGNEAKHNESKVAYPEVNLSPGEYVIEFVRRHPIGLLSIWLLVGFVSIALLALLPVYANNEQGFSNALGFQLPSAAVLSIPVLIIVALFVLGGFIATIVYEGNRFYLTNESVIQHVKTSIFNDKKQVINLVNVEDVSFDRQGILQQLLNYGTLRLSTQGQETIYRFYFVRNPEQVANAVNDAVEIAMRSLEGDLRAHQIRE